MLNRADIGLAQLSYFVKAKHSHRPCYKKTSAVVFSITGGQDRHSSVATAEMSDQGCPLRQTEASHGCKCRGFPAGR